MSQSYNDDQNPPGIPENQHPQYPPHPPYPPPQKTWGDWISDNKILVFIIVVIIAVLIWYFCFRTGTGEVKVGEGSVGTHGGSSGLSVCRQKGSSDFPNMR